MKKQRRRPVQPELPWTTRQLTGFGLNKVMLNRVSTQTSFVVHAQCSLPKVSDANSEEKASYLSLSSSRRIVFFSCRLSVLSWRGHPHGFFLWKEAAQPLHGSEGGEERKLHLAKKSLTGKNFTRIKSSLNFMKPFRGNFPLLLSWDLGWKMCCQ